MVDIFHKDDVSKLMKNQFILFLGGSNIKSLYQDLICLQCENDIGSPKLFRRLPIEKRWKSFKGDRVIRVSIKRNAGRDYFEEREYKKSGFHFRFHFITRVWGSSMKRTLSLIENRTIPIPDIIVVNSCSWDLTRWGALKVDVYKSELIQAFSEFKRILPEKTLIIWTTTPPLSSQKMKGGFLVKQLEFLKSCLRFMILEANKFTQLLCRVFEIDLLDLHYYLRFQLHRRAVDGVHWENYAIRFITCLLLTHITIAFRVPLPGRIHSWYLENVIRKADEDGSNAKVFTKEIKELVKIKLLEMKKPRKKGMKHYRNICKREIKGPRRKIRKRNRNKNKRRKMQKYENTNRLSFEGKDVRTHKSTSYSFVENPVGSNIFKESSVLYLENEVNSSRLKRSSWNLKIGNAVPKKKTYKEKVTSNETVIDDIQICKLDNSNTTNEETNLAVADYSKPETYMLKTNTSKTVLQIKANVQDITTMKEDGVEDIFKTWDLKKSSMIDPLSYHKLSILKVERSTIKEGVEDIFKTWDLKESTMIDPLSYHKLSILKVDRSDRNLSDVPNNSSSVEGYIDILSYYKLGIKT
ncbi:UNVERIFIED_CONTAM: hypothetical protein RMT77_007277 [Armadillidium vulgare]